MGRSCGLDSLAFPGHHVVAYKTLMTVFRQSTSSILRTFLLLALLVQSITSTGMLFKMASAQAAPVLGEYIIICTPEGPKSVAWSDIDGDAPPSQHSCVCAGGVLCSQCCAVFYDSRFSSVSYPGTNHLRAIIWQNKEFTPPTPHDLNIGHPRAPPVLSHT